MRTVGILALVLIAGTLAAQQPQQESAPIPSILQNYKPLAAEEKYSLKTVKEIIEGAKKHPMSPAGLRAENERLMKYGERQAKKVGIKERDIPRVIHESRSRRRTS